MNTIAEHTPIPWRYISEYDEAYIDGPEPSQKGMINFYLCETSVGHANAAFIVRAVNSHEELLRIVKDLRHRSFDPTFKGWDKNKLDQAIAKAEGK